MMTTTFQQRKMSESLNVNYILKAEMTKTVQMKEAFKRPVRKITKHKTESKDGKEFK